MGWLTGWNYRQTITIPSSGWSLSGNLTNQSVKVNIPSSNTAFWAGVKADGTDVRFTASDGSTLLDFEIEKFDSTGDDAAYHVEVATLTYASDTTIYVYYGNAAATSGESINATWDSNYKAVYHLSQNKATGAFADSTSNANNGTNNGTTDVAGQIDRGRNFLQSSSQYISIADSNSLSFGNGTTDTPMTIEAWVNMTDATRFNIFRKGGTNLEYDFRTGGVDTLFLALYDNSSANQIYQISSSAITADEGSWIHLVATYDGSGSNTGIIIYRNGAVLTTTPGSSGTYVAMENTADSVTIGQEVSNYSNGSKDEITISAVARSADWIKARYNSAIGTWTFGGEQHFDALPEPVIGTFAIPAPTIALNVNVSPTAVTGTFTISAPAVTGPAFATPDPVTGTFTIPAPDVQKVVVLADPVTGTFTMLAPTVTLPTIVTVNPVTGTFSILAPDVTEIVAVLLGVSNFPQSSTVEYEIVDSDGVTLQAWTSVGVNEVQGPTKSAYYVKTNVIGGGVESRGIIYWRTSDLAYEASDVFDTTQANIATLLQRLTYNRAANLDNLDVASSTRLATSAYTAPDNAGIAANGVAIAANATALTTINTIVTLIRKHATNKMVEVDNGNRTKTFTIYDNDNSTAILTYSYNVDTLTRSKAVE